MGTAAVASFSPRPTRTWGLAWRRPRAWRALQRPNLALERVGAAAIERLRQEGKSASAPAGRRVDRSCGWHGEDYSYDREMSYAFYGHRLTAEPEPPERRPGSRLWKLGALSRRTKPD